MNRQKLDKKRLEPCVADIYAHAKGPTGNCFPQSYDTWKEHGVWAFYNGDRKKPITIVPLDCYHLDSDDLKKIVEKWCKGLHGYWYYTPKLNYEDPDYRKKVKELEDFRKFEAEVSKDKTLTYAQRAAKIRKEAIAHNFMWRSSDKEYINFNVYLGVSPNSNKEWVEKNHIVYNAIEEASRAGLISNLYVDYVHMDTFTYTKDGKTYYAQIEEMNYYHDDDKLVCEKTPGRSYCNLYDSDGGFVENLWDYENIRRCLSAETMEVMVTKYKPIVIDTLKSQGHSDVAEWLVRHNYTDNKDLKQCFAVWIMSQAYMAHKADNGETEVTE